MDTKRCFCLFGLLAIVAVLYPSLDEALGESTDSTNLPVVVGRAVRFGIAPPLSRIEAASARTAASRRTFREIPRVDRPKDEYARERTAAMADAILQRSRTSGLMPDPLITFEGIDNLDAVAPPDCNGDVGPNHYLEMVNFHFCIYDKTTGDNLIEPMLMSSLYAAAGFPPPVSTLDNGDPIVLYDSQADRWMISQFIVDVTPCHEVIAISQTPDPTGSWYLYDFVMPNHAMNDYPHFGVWSDGYYMSDNQFDQYGGVGVFAFEREKMLNGDPSATYQYFNLYLVDPRFFGLLPSDLDGPPPPAGTPNFFMMVDQSVINPFPALYLWEFRVDWDNPANSTFGNSGRPNYTNQVAAFNWTFPDGRNTVPQPGTTQRLDPLGDRLMHRVQYRNFGAYESLVGCHTVNVGNNNQTGIRYYQLRRPIGEGPFTIFEQATFAPDGDSRWMGSAAADSQGNLAVGYSVSGTGTYPSIRYAGRRATDPSNGLFQEEATLFSGSASQVGVNRWGDYTALTVDPTDDLTFWYVNQYSAGSWNWRTRIGSFRLALLASGYVQGMVANVLTGEGIANARITFSKGFFEQTEMDGSYLIQATTGRWNAAASADGYYPSTTSVVDIILNETSTLNFALSPIPLQVKPESGLSASGPQGGPFTPDWVIYSLSNATRSDLTWFAERTKDWVSLSSTGGMLAAGAVTSLTGRIHYLAEFLAVGADTDEVRLGWITAEESASTTRRFTLNITPYVPPPLTNWDFIAGQPAGWSIGGSGWSFSNPCLRGNYTGGTGIFAIADSDCAGEVAMDTELRSPALDFSDKHFAYLSFKTDFRIYSGNEVAAVDVSANGTAGPWTNLWRQSFAVRGPTNILLDVDSIFSGQSHVVFRFHYTAYYDYWWQVDDVMLYGQTVESGALKVYPYSGVTWEEYFGGPFDGSKVYRLTNSSSSSMSWTSDCAPTWIYVVPSGGELAPGAVEDVALNMNPETGTFRPGNYGGIVTFSNSADTNLIHRGVELTIQEPLLLAPSQNLVASGLEGGPFAPSNRVYVLTNRSSHSVTWTCHTSSAWLEVFPAGGSLDAGDAQSVTLTMVTNLLTAPGDYQDTVVFSNVVTGVVFTRAVTVTVIEVTGHIAVYDSIPPTNDLYVPFGVVTGDTPRLNHITVVNSGANNRNLVISNIYLGYYQFSFDGEAEGWAPSYPGEWQVNYGAYRASATDDGWMASVFEKQQWQNLSVETLMRRSGASNVSQGVAVRASSDFDPQGRGSAYIFLLADGRYSVWKQEGSARTVLQGWSISTGIRAVSNQIDVTASGEELRLLINGVMVWKGNDFSLTEGHVALVGYTQPSRVGGACDHYFENIAVTRPQPPGLGISRKQLFYNGIEQRDSRMEGLDSGKIILEAADPGLVSNSGLELAPLSPALTSSFFSITNLPVFPTTIEPGESIEFDVIYAPHLAQSNTETVSILNNDNDTPRVDALMDGRAAASILRGRVTDAYTALPIGGAQIDVSNGITHWTTTASANGVYSLNLPAGGWTFFLTVTATHYATGIVAVALPSDGMVVTQNIELAASRLTYSPPELDEFVMAGGRVTNRVVVSNSGPITLSYALHVGPHGDLRTNELFQYEVSSGSAETDCLGVEYDGTNFWMTGAGSGSNPNFLYKLTQQGAYVARFEQGTTSSWGWRDLAFDGTFLYASDSTLIQQISRSNGQPTGVTIPGPLDPNRALAYDPETDHFWVAGFVTPIYEIDRSGNIIHQYDNTLPIFGLGWDNSSPDGPWLWVWSQEGTPSCRLSQFNPRTGSFTEYLRQGLADPGGYAGGACFAQFDQYRVVVGIHQISGNDWMIGYILSEMAPDWVTLSSNAGVLEPGASEMFDVVFDSNAATSAAPPSTSLAWLSFDSESVDEPLRMPLAMRVTVDGMTVTPADSLHFNGSVGGSFNPTTQELVVENIGAGPFSWSVTASSNWLTCLPTSGVVAMGTAQTLHVMINTNAHALPLGEYNVQLVFSNHMSGMIIQRDVKLVVRHDRVTICSYDMETDPGWITQGQWAYGAPQGGGSFNRDPPSGFTGAHVYGYNLDGDYSNDLPRRCLMTTPLDFSRYAHVEMSFRRWLGVEDARYDHAGIECSADGIHWTEVWRNSGKAIADASWQSITCKLASVTYAQSGVYVRWVMGETDNSVTYPGWNIDDVVFRGSLLRRLIVRSAYGQASPAEGEYFFYDGFSVACGITNMLIEGSHTQYFFTGWARDGCAPTSGTSADITFALTNDATVIWLWDTNVYFSMAADAHGAVFGSDSGWYKLGDEVLAWAMADAHYHFVSWSGAPDLQTNENPLALTMDRARLITAQFAVNSHRLTVQSDFGSPNPAVGTHTYDYGAVLTNTVNQTETEGTTQHVCAGWTLNGNEPGAGLTNRWIMTLTNDATLTWLWRTNFSFTCSAGSNGSVIGSSSGWYAQGSFVVLLASPSPGYYFAGWTGDVPASETNTNPLILAMDRPRSVLAHFGRVVSYTNTIAKMTQWITNRMAETDVVGLSIALMDDQSMVWAHGFGYADQSNGVPVDKDTMFDIGSLARTLEAAAILRLTETAEMNLDAPFTNYLPHFSIHQRFSNNEITLRTILNDHSGIPGDILNGAFTTRPWTNYSDWVIEWLSGEHTTAPTNTIWADNNSGYAVLSRAIEEVAGQSFQEFVMANLFQRMNMTNSVFYPDEPSLIHRLAKPYFERKEYLLEYGNETTAGSVYSSASDMAQYIKMILAYGEGANGSVLQSNTVEQMMTRQNVGNPYDAMAIGLAWVVNDAPLDYAGRICWREGRSVFYRCMLKILRDHKLGVFVACNSADDGGIQDAAALRCLQLALEDKTGIAPPSPFVPPFAPITNRPIAELDAVTGIYVSAYGYDRVTRKEGTLEFAAGAHLDNPEMFTNLVPRANGWFSAPESQDVQFEFRFLDGRHVLYLHEIVNDAPSTILRGEQRISLPVISAAWSNRLGEHDIINLQEYDISRACPLEIRPVALFVRLVIKDGLLLAVSPFGHLGTMVLEPQSDSLAFALGLGRNRGQALQIVQTNGLERIRLMGGWYEYALPTLNGMIRDSTNFYLTVSNIHAGVTGRIERTGNLHSPVQWETRYLFTPSAGGGSTNWSELMETNSAFYRFLYK